ncbi:MAG TPA: beta-propeller domain-containing protein [Thermoleophilaceae bacterium]|nr:beta-propeller domain-containing protein [Thermoleophilaceae bacterium]
MLRRAPLILALGVSLSIPAGSPAVEADAAGKQRPRAAKAQLEPFRSCTALVRYARRNVRRGPGIFPPPVGGIAPLPPRRIDSPSSGPGPMPLSAPGAEADQSPTNVQEQGVDEPDVVKAAGGRIFAVAGGQLHAIDAGGPRLLGSLPLEGYAHELLLHGKRLLVMSQHGAGGVGIEPASSQAYSPDPVTRLTEVDVSDPARMTVIRTQRVRGLFVSARLTGAIARVVVTSTPRASTEPELRSRLRGWLAHTTVANRLTGRKRTRPATRCRAVRRAQVYSGLDMLTVLTIDMDKGLPEVDSDAVMTGAEIVYASPRRLYVATQRWIAQSVPEQNLHGGTTIHEFDASDSGETTYHASGSVPGFLLNQWAMSERGGVLRVASSEAPTWLGGSELEGQSFVTTLARRDGRLAQLGQVGGLGRGERIYSVRFIDDVGYVVTFRQVDPLYTVDLSAPAEPKVRGELKIRGYSAYLHPVGGDLLLGVGQDATEAGQLLGTQLSLFDVSDLARPRRLHQRTVRPGSSSDVEYDHHAFLWWAPTKLAVMPVQYATEQDYFTGALGFRVERSSGIGEVGSASHKAGDYIAPIQRSFVVGGRLFTLSDLGLEENDLADLSEKAWLELPAASP